MNLLNDPNMMPLKPSRRRLSPGDVFVMRYPRVDYVFGRVILTNLPIERAPMPGCNLVYIYRAFSPEADVDGVSLSAENLLIPPAFINRLPWSRGYFQTVRSSALLPSDVLTTHSFCRSIQGNVSYRDLDGRRLAGPIEPCGAWGLHSYRSLDDEISDALGIAQAA